MCLAVQEAMPEGRIIYYITHQRNKKRKAGSYAKPNHNHLKTFFKKTKRKTRANQSTQKQLKKDVKSLLKGTKEGTIVIKNENPTVSGGKRTITDTSHTDFFVQILAQNGVHSLF
jgi:hypothetical protein